MYIYNPLLHTVCNYWTGEKQGTRFLYICKIIEVQFCGIADTQQSTIIKSNSIQGMFIVSQVFIHICRRSITDSITRKQSYENKYLEIEAINNVIFVFYY